MKQGLASPDCFISRKQPIGLNKAMYPEAFNK